MGLDGISVQCLAGAGCLKIMNSHIDVDNYYYLMIIVM